MLVYASLATYEYLTGRGYQQPKWMNITAYLLLDAYCDASCSYCWLSYIRSEKPRLARVTWHPVSIEDVVDRLRGYARLCIQGVERPGVEERIIELVRYVRSAGYRGGISVSYTTLDTSFYEELYALGVDYIGLGVDVASERLRASYGKRYSLEDYLHLASRLKTIYGYGRVYMHLIIGLGEYADEVAGFIDTVYSLGARVALFAYTPSRPWGPASPQICYYRGAQLYRQLVEEVDDARRFIQPVRGEQSWILVDAPPVDVIRRSVVTSGCPGCNRPYYNESPRSPGYNIPAPELIPKRIVEEVLNCFSSSRVRPTSR